MYATQISGVVVPIPATTSVMLTALLEDDVAEEELVDFLFAEKVIHAIRHGLRECLGEHVVSFKFTVNHVEAKLVSISVHEIATPRSTYIAEATVVVDPVSSAVVISTVKPTQVNESPKKTVIELFNGYLRSLGNGVYEAVFYI